MNSPALQLTDKERQEIFQEIPKEIRKELARRKLINFTKYTFKTYQVTRHNTLMADYLDKWREGIMPRLIISMPPQNGKSEQAARRLPAFILGKDPQSEIVVATYAQELVNKHSRIAKNIIESDEYKELFPNIIPSDRWSVEEWEINDKEQIATGNKMAIGSFKGVGREGGLTGSGFKYGIIDDIFSGRKEAESLTVREGVWDWFTSVFLTRTAPDARILIIMTQWHEDDLKGRLLKQMLQGEGEHYDILNLAALIETEEEAKVDPLHRKVGEALWPDKYSAEWLQNKKKTIGTYDWNALYKGMPTGKKSKKIQRHWFEIVDRAPDLRWFRFWDLAVTKKTTAYRTASVAMGRDVDGYLYLKDMISVQETWPVVRKIMLQTMQMEGVKAEYGIEKAGQQGGFIDDVLMSQEFLPYIIKAYTPDADKLTRALPWIAKAEDRKIRLVKGEWLGNFFSVCDEFTGHDDKRDDEIDAVSGAYHMISQNPEVRIRRI